MGSFLSDQKQRVVLDGCKSSEANVLQVFLKELFLAVPSPFLFLVFIDLPGWVKHSGIRFFADDSLLFRQINSQKDAELIQQDIKALEDWKKTWPRGYKTIRLKIKRSDWLLADTCPQAANHCVLF